ncbi:hypothetical protein GCM10020219_094260 [Nonomuraea dietziae]
MLGGAERLERPGDQPVVATLRDREDGKRRALGIEQRDPVARLRSWHPQGDGRRPRGAVGERAVRLDLVQVVVSEEAGQWMEGPGKEQLQVGELALVGGPLEVRRHRSTIPIDLVGLPYPVISTGRNDCGAS